MKAEMLLSKVKKRVIGMFIKIVRIYNYYPVDISTIVFSCETIIKYWTTFNSSSSLFHGHSLPLVQKYSFCTSDSGIWLGIVQVGQLHFHELIASENVTHELRMSMETSYLTIYNIRFVFHFVFELALVEFVSPTKVDQLYVMVNLMKLSMSIPAEMSNHKTY